MFFYFFRYSFQQCFIVVKVQVSHLWCVLNNCLLLDSTKNIIVFHFWIFHYKCVKIFFLFVYLSCILKHYLFISSHHIFLDSLGFYICMIKSSMNRYIITSPFQSGWLFFFLPIGIHKAFNTIWNRSGKTTYFYLLPDLRGKNPVLHY